MDRLALGFNFGLSLGLRFLFLANSPLGPIFLFFIDELEFLSWLWLELLIHLIGSLAQVGGAAIFTFGAFINLPLGLLFDIHDCFIKIVVLRNDLNDEFG